MIRGLFYGIGTLLAGFGIYCGWMASSLQQKCDNLSYMDLLLREDVALNAQIAQYAQYISPCIIIGVALLFLGYLIDIITEL